MLLDVIETTIRSKYDWPYLISDIQGRQIRKARRSIDKSDRYGISTATAMSTLLLHPHLGPPTF